VRLNNKTSLFETILGFPRLILKADTRLTIYIFQALRLHVLHQRWRKSLLMSY